MAVLLRLPVERELVRGRAELSGRVLVERPRVPDLVLRDRREGDVLLEERRDPCPLRVPPAEDQLVVSELEQLLRVHVLSPASLSADNRRRGGSSSAARRRSRRSRARPRAGRPTEPSTRRGG